MFYTIIVIILSSLILLTIKLLKKKSPSYQLKEIYIYPIKSCAGIKVESHTLDQYGFKYDRNWIIVDEKGVLVTQREYPKMSLIKTNLDDKYLTISVEGMGTKKIPLELNEDGKEKTAIRVWKSKCYGIVEDDDICEWISKFIDSNRSFKLVRVPSDHERRISNKYLSEGLNDNVSYVDSMPFLVVTDASVYNLEKESKELNKDDTIQFIVTRFRPNIVVSGANPLEEFKWKTLRIGNVKFYSSKPCDRCKLTTVDPEKGIFSGDEPLNTIKKKFSGKFGNYFIHDKESYGQSISVGMKVNVLEKVN